MDDYMYLLFELCGTGPGCSPEKNSHREEPAVAPRPRRPSRRPPGRRTLAAVAATH